MAKKLQILIFPDPRLRKVAEKVIQKELESKEKQIQLVDQLLKDTDLK